MTRPRRSRADPAGDGAQCLIRRYGRFIAFAATVQEVAEYLDVASLRREDPD